MTKKNESSTAGASLKGFSAPFGVRVIRRKRNVKDNNVSKPYGEPELYEHASALAALTGLPIETVLEVVKKSGNRYVVTNDKTGSTVGSYEKASDAWEKQRLVRKQNKNKNSQKTKSATQKPPKTKDKAQKAPTAKKAPKAQKAPKPKVSKVKKEQFLKQLKERFAQVLKEGNMLSYVFEQNPTSSDSAQWEKFISHLSRETVMADPKLKAILQNVAKNEAKILGMAVNQIKKVLENVGPFQVNQKGVDQDAHGDVIMNFDVAIEGSKKLGFAVKIENGHPLILFPDETRMTLNTLSTDESKLLRAEIMHIQETVLDNMHDVVQATEKRDSYLRGMQDKLDKVIGSFGPLEVAMLKNLLKQKYK